MKTSDVVALLVKNDVSTVEVLVMAVDDAREATYRIWLRARVHRGRPRWAHVPIVKDDGNVFAAVLGQHIESKFRASYLTDNPSLQIEGVAVVPVSDADAEEFESGHWQPNSLLTRAKRALDKPMPNTWRVENSEAAADQIFDIAKALYRDEPLTEWTEPREKSLQGSLKIESAASEYTLSNGDPFYPRPVLEIDGAAINDVEFLHIQFKRGKVPLLMGPGGTGKTSVVEAACDVMFTTLFTAETTTLSLSGRWEPHPEIHSEYVWGVSTLVQSIQHAIEHPDQRVIWYGDEVMQTAPEVLVMLHGLMDHRRTLFIEEGPGKGELKAPNNWSMVLSSNPNEPGSSIGRPFASRCAPLDYWTNWDVVEAAIGPGFDQLITVGRVMETMRRNREVDWAPAVRHCVAAARDMQDLGVRFGLRQLLANCDLETGKCESKDLRRLEQVINEVYDLANITKMTLE